MDPRLGASLIVVVWSLMLVRAWRFRRGPTGNELAIYRRTRIRTYANLTLVIPVVAPLSPLWVAWLIAGAFAVDIPPTSHLGTLVTMGGTGAFLLTFGLATLVSFRLPRWLLPPWLAADDERVGFGRQRPGWFDWLLLVAFGLPSVAVGLGFFGAVLLELVGVIRPR